MVGVVVGEHQQVDPVHPHGAQIVGGQVSGVPPGAAAAVHQGYTVPGPEGHALALAHVQGGEGQGAHAVGRVVEHQRRAEHYDRAAQGDQGAPGPPEGEEAQPQQVEHRQAAQEVGPVHRQGGIGDPGKAPGQKEHQPGEDCQQAPQELGRSRQRQGQQGGEEPGLEGELDEEEAQKVGHRGDQGDGAEVPGPQGQGEGGGPHGGAQGDGRPPEEP